MSDELILELCVDSVDSAIAAQQGGAHRIELCDNLVEGGTTPSAGTIALARKHLDIDIQIIIRPRGGDFCYTDVEFEIMKYDIEEAKQLGANGVVIGLLTPIGSIDMERTTELVALARPMNVTFHRAFDMTCDPFQALEDLISLGINRVLTSGQEISVLEGLDLITELVKKAAGRIIIMPGGGITERNIHKIVSQSGVAEVHATARVSVDSTMNYRNTQVFMGGELRTPEYSRLVTDSGRVRLFLDAIE